MTSIHVRRLENRIAATAARFVDYAARTGVGVADLRSVKLPWYEIREQETEGADAVPDESATVFLFDEIGGSFGASAKSFVDQIEGIKAPTIKVRINSPGGSLMDAVAIYNALNHHSSRIVVYVDSLAASAASIVAMGGDEIVMMPGSQMMIHDASVTQIGNAAEMAKVSTFLDRQSNNIANIYCMRAGGTVAEWRQLMLDETWMFAEEATSMGLADSVESAPKKKSRTPQYGDMTRTFDTSHFRYASRRDAPAPSRRGIGHERKAGSQMQVHARSDIGFCVRAFEFEMRNINGDGRTLEGHAAVFNTPSRIRDLGGDFDEVIMPGAFTRSLERRTPVMQFEHGRDPRVGAVPIAAVEDIREDETGLFVRARLFDNPVVEPVRQAIVGRAIKGMSFRFQVPEGGDKWKSRTGDVDLRAVYETDTRELGPVVFPAYDTTSVSVRSLLAQLDPDEHRNLIRELAAELRQVADLSDFTGRPDARSAGGGDPRVASSNAATPTPTTQQSLDDGALRARGIRL